MEVVPPVLAPLEERHDDRPHHRPLPRGGVAGPGDRRGRRLDAGALALRQRRRDLPDRPAGRGAAPAHGRGRRCSRGGPRDRRTADDARGRHLDRRQRDRGRDRRGHHPPPQPGPGRRRGGPHGPRRAGGGARQRAEARRAPRAALRTRPVDPHPLHDRRDDRQQRVRVARPRLRPHGRQRRGAHRPARRRHRRARRSPRRSRRPGGPAPGHRPHGVRPVRPPGLRLLLRAAAARARPPLRPLPGRHRGHPRRRARRHHPAGRGRPGPRAGGAGLPVDGRGGRRRARPADPPAGRPGGPRPAHRRARAHPPRAARRRRLAVRRGHRSDPRRGLGRRPGGGRRRRGALPGRRRRGGAAGPVEDPRGRRRPGRALAEPPRPGRVGGHRGAPGEAGCLPARLRRPAQEPPARRRALRPLRRRLRPRAHRLRARERGRARHLPQLRRGGRRPRRLLRRLDVR